MCKVNLIFLAFVALLTLSIEAKQSADEIISKPVRKGLISPENFLRNLLIRKKQCQWKFCKQGSTSPDDPKVATFIFRLFDKTNASGHMKQKIKEKLEQKQREHLKLVQNQLHQQMDLRHKEAFLREITHLFSRFY